MSGTADLILLPGLGADARQFDPQRSAFPSLRSVPWISNRRRESLEQYAARLADTFDLSPDSVIGGSSFGGMVALEIARRKRPRAVILIGSCRSPRAIAAWIRAAGRMGSWMPGYVVNSGRALAPLLSRVVGPADPGVRRKVVEMSGATPAEFLKWAGWAVSTWGGCQDPGVPVRAIHGEFDHVMPLGRVAADRVVRGAGHVVNMTHAQEVNAFISTVLHEA